MDNVPVFVLQPDLGGLLSLAVTVFLPILVGLVTTRLTSPGMRAVLLLLLATIKTIVEAVIAANMAGAEPAWQLIVFNAVVNFGVAVAVHFGLWKPTGASDRAVDSGITSR
jgi:hypothetical protein